MSNIRSVAAAMTFIGALACASAPARACDASGGRCNSVQGKAQTAPLSLSQFMKRPVQAKAVPATAKLPVSPGKPHVRTTAKPVARPAVADAVANPGAIPAPVTASDLASLALSGRETDGVSIASPDEINEIDAAADAVRIVAANELNEIDLAADRPAAARNAPGIAEAAAATAPKPPADTGWTGELFVALGGIVVAAAAARLLIV